MYKVLAEQYEMFKSCLYLKYINIEHKKNNLYTMKYGPV